MTRDERLGLGLLVAFLLVAGVLFSAATNGGRAVTNIVANLIAYPDDLQSPEIDAQLDPIKQGLNADWVIGFTATLTAFLALATTAIYLVARRRTPRSWLVFLIIVGAAAIPLALAAAQAQNALLAIPAPDFGSSARDGLLAGVDMLNSIVLLVGASALIGLALLVWSLVRQPRS